MNADMYKNNKELDLHMCVLIYGRSLVFSESQLDHSDCMRTRIVYRLFEEGRLAQSEVIK
jgi:hypothetical protein